MTVETTTNRATFNGSGSTGPYQFPFRFFANSEITVTRTNSAGVVSYLNEGSDYTLSGAGTYTGGVLTLTTALNLGETLNAYRVIPLTQPTSIRNMGAFYPNIHEDAFDRVIMIAQQLANGSPAPVIPVTSSVSISTYNGNLATALTTLGGNNATLVIDTPTTANDNLTIPANISIIVMKPGQITIASGKVLTITGSFAAGRYQVFAGDGTVTFSAGSVDETYPEWWGANPLGTVDAAANVFKAIAAVQGTGAVLKLSGMYRMNQGMKNAAQVISQTIRIVGNGLNTGFLNYSTDNTDAILYVNGTGAAWPYANGSTFEDFSIVGDKNVSRGSGIETRNHAAYITYKNLHLTGNNHGIHYYVPNDGNAGTSYGAKFDHCWAIGNNGAGFVEDNYEVAYPNAGATAGYNMATFDTCVGESNAHGIWWSSGQVQVDGGVFQSNLTNEMYFKRQAVLHKVYFEESATTYGDNAMVHLGGPYSVVEGCTFLTNGTTHIIGVEYNSVLNSIKDNLFQAAVTGGVPPVGGIGVKSLLAANSQSSIIDNAFDGIETTVNITAEGVSTTAVYRSQSPVVSTINIKAGITNSGGTGVITAPVTIDPGADLTYDLGTDTNHYKTIYARTIGPSKIISFGGYQEGSTSNNYSIFLDSENSNKLSYKDGSGTVHTINLTP